MMNRLRAPKTCSDSSGRLTVTVGGLASPVYTDDSAVVRFMTNS